MTKVKTRSKIIVRQIDANHVKVLAHEIIRRGSRKKFLITKRGIFSKEAAQKWHATWLAFKKLKIPTVKEFSLVPHPRFPKTWVDIKQNDFARSGKAPLTNAHNIEDAIFKTSYGNDPCYAIAVKYALQFKRPFLGIARDLATMHKNRFVCINENELLLAPWVFYIKPNKKLDRAVVDFGSIKIAESELEHEVYVRKNLSAFEHFLILLGNEKFKEDVIRAYLKINPNPQYAFS